MTRKPTFISALCCLGVATMLGSCFTGIESTPRITENDVRNSGVKVTPEQSLTAGISTQRPADWRPGKQWVVNDDKISMIFTSASGNTSSLAGDTLTLRRIGSYPTLTGNDGLEIVFTRSHGYDSLYYRPDIAMTDLESRNRLEIPFTVDLGPVAIADSLLRGNTYYIVTSNWYDATGNAVAGLRHVPVTITGVTAGSGIYPLKVAFHSADTPTIRCVMMTYGSSATATRNFDRLFSLTDPRLNYPRIRPETWDKIIHSQVTDGMTRDECRLALGAPATINHGASSAGQYERWNYDNGIYLIFEDGILIRYRK
ncbi:MAG: hypothetical protein Q4C34_04305 [Bacteroidales bacterium]|nr:hypothetical protein [Bacteroidales bacterium]